MSELFKKGYKTLMLTSWYWPSMYLSTKDDRASLDTKGAMEQMLIFESGSSKDFINKASQSSLERNGNMACNGISLYSSDPFKIS